VRLSYILTLRDGDPAADDEFDRFPNVHVQQVDGHGEMESATLPDSTLEQVAHEALDGILAHYREQQGR
jgi:hypothetical protein